MSNSWDEREKALEDGYFRQKDNELIARMKAKLNTTAPSEMDCPKGDGGKLHSGNFEAVQIEMCDKCGGVWLDAGELQQIMHKEQQNAGWLGRLFG